MSGPRRGVIVLTVAVVLVLGSGVVLALSDTGIAIPAAVIIVAAAVCLLAVVVAGLYGYRDSRLDGHGFWRSVARGFGTAGRTVLDLF